MSVAVLEFVAQLARRKLMFLVALAAVAIIGASAAHGWSWTSFIVTVIALLVLFFAWAMVTFWIWVIRNSGRQGDVR